MRSIIKKNIPPTHIQGLVTHPVFTIILFRLNHKPALIEGTDELKWFNYETFAQPLEKVLNSKNSNKKKEKSVNKDRGWFYRKEVET